MAKQVNLFEEEKHEPEKYGLHFSSLAVRTQALKQLANLKQSDPVYYTAVMAAIQRYYVKCRQLGTPTTSAHLVISEAIETVREAEKVEVPVITREPFRNYMAQYQGLAA